MKVNIKGNKKSRIIVRIAYLAALILIPFLFENTYYQMLLDKVIINAIVVIGLNFITGLVGQMNTGTAGMFALGAYSSALLTTKLGVSPWFGILAALIMGCIIGIVLGYPSLRVSGIYLVLTTLAFAEIVRLVLTNMADFTGGALGVRSIPEFTLIGIKLEKSSKGFYYLLAVILVIVVLIANRIIKSKWGRAFKAVRDNPDAAETCGINISGIKIRAFTLASVYGCIAGALYSVLLGFLTPDEFSSVMSVRFIMMLMVGGIGTIGGCIAGAFTVTLLPEVLRPLGNSYWFVFCFVVLLCAIFVPNGLYTLVNIVKEMFAKILKKAGGKNRNTVEDN